MVRITTNRERRRDFQAGAFLNFLNSPPNPNSISRGMDTLIAESSILREQEPKPLVKIPGLGLIVQSYGTFYENLLKLRGVGATIISSRQEAYARMRTAEEDSIGGCSTISTPCQGTHVTAGIEFSKKGDPLLRINSRLLDCSLAAKAVELCAKKHANIRDSYFTQPIDFYEESLAQAREDESKKFCERKVMALPSRDTFEIDSHDNFGVLEFLLGPYAKEYLNLRRKNKFYANEPIRLELVKKEIVDRQNGTILTQLYFSSLCSLGGFNGGNHSENLHYFWNDQGIIHEGIPPCI